MTALPPVDGTTPTRSEPLALGPTDALIVVDMQNDFAPGGSLAVAEGDHVAEVLNRLLPRFSTHVFTQDWHPADHCSFADEPRFEDGSWPVHCVAGTHGADFVPGLTVPDDAIRIHKGTDRAREAYSGFDGTDLAEQLRARGVQRVVVGGLATDYCVLNTVLDAVKEGFQTWVLLDGTRAVADGAGAVQQMLDAGAHSLTTEQLQ